MIVHCIHLYGFGFLFIAVLWFVMFLWSCIASCFLLLVWGRGYGRNLAFLLTRSHHALFNIMHYSAWIKKKKKKEFRCKLRRMFLIPALTKKWVKKAFIWLSFQHYRHIYGPPAVSWITPVTDSSVCVAGVLSGDKCGEHFTGNASLNDFICLTCASVAPMNHMRGLNQRGKTWRKLTFIRGRTWK